MIKICEPTTSIDAIWRPIAHGVNKDGIRFLQWMHTFLRKLEAWNIWEF